MKIYAVYKDKGAKGGCGQAMSTTAPRNELMIFDSYEDYRSFYEKVDNCKNRESPLIESIYSDDTSLDMCKVIEIKKE